MSEVIYISSDIRDSKESTKNLFEHFKAPSLDRNDDGSLIDPNDRTISIEDMVDSVRCLEISPDGLHLASGDEVGNIRIH